MPGANDTRLTAWTLIAPPRACRTPRDSHALSSLATQRATRSGTWFKPTWGKGNNIFFSTRLGREGDSSFLASLFLSFLSSFFLIQQPDKRKEISNAENFELVILFLNIYQGRPPDSVKCKLARRRGLSLTVIFENMFTLNIFETINPTTKMGMTIFLENWISCNFYLTHFFFYNSYFFSHDTSNWTIFNGCLIDPFKKYASKVILTKLRCTVNKKIWV